jgi:Transposase DDE domain
MGYREIRNFYCHYLLESHVNFTCTHLSDCSDISHDKINRFLNSYCTEESSLYEKLYLDSPPLSAGGYLIFDDTVLDKSYSHKIEMVRRQYSGNVGGVVVGIGVVVMLYYVPSEDKFYLLGYRVFDPALDGKSKVDHVGDLLSEADKHCVPYRGVLMDSWYGVAKLFQRIHHAGKYFYCPLKTNRLVKEPHHPTYFSVGELKWNATEQQQGKSLKVKGLGLEVRLYQVPVSTNRTDYILTNDLRESSAQTIGYNNRMRWHIEEFNRELKQLTGLEKCQCRKAPAQRSHIFCAMLVWHTLKQRAYQAYQTIYHIKRLPLRNFLTQQLKMDTPSFAW